MTWSRFDARELRLHYLDEGHAGQPAVIALHGWPDAPQTWRHLLPALRAAGYRVITPYLRGFGPNRFHDPARRSGQLSAISDDIRQLADHLRLERFSVVGHDWGARCAYILSALYPQRVVRAVAMSAPYAPGVSLSWEQTQAYWYQWYMSTRQGRQAVKAQREVFCRELWRRWSPQWAFADEDFAPALAAMDNPDWAQVTLHSYTQRWGNAEADPGCAELETRLAASPQVKVPCLIIHGQADRCNLAEGFHDLHAFTGGVERLELPGVGHFPQHEARETVNQAIERWLGQA